MFEEDRQRLEAGEQTAGPVQSRIEPPITQTAATRAAAHITFRNSRAVVTSLLVAGVSVLAFALVSLIAPPLFPLLLCGAGYVSVRVYRARSLEVVSAGAGAKLGWMTGLWVFLVVAIMLAMLSMVIATPQGWEQIRSTWAQVPQASKFLRLSQHDFLMQLLIALPSSFLTLTILPGLGGLLGAKFPQPRVQS